MKLRRPTMLLLVGAFLGTLLLAVDVGVSMVREVSAAGEIPPESLIRPRVVIPLPSSEAAAPPEPTATRTQTPRPTQASEPTIEPEPTRSPPAQRQTIEASTPSRPKPPAGTLLAVKGSPGFDNNPRDWATAAVMRSASIVSGTDTGISAQWQALWDNQALYLRAIVRDQKIVQPFVDNPGQLFRGDSVSLELGAAATKLSDDAGLRAGDAHYLFGPKPDGGRVVRAVNPVGGGSFANGTADPQARAVQHLTETGYVMEIAIDWSLIGVKPVDGRVLAANFNVSDGNAAGDLRAMKSTNPRRTSEGQNHPGRWQTLTLRD